MQDRDVSGRLSSVDSTLPGLCSDALVWAGSFAFETMNFHGRTLVLTGGALAWVLALPAAAQGNDLALLVNRTQLAMDAEDWEEALRCSNTAIERFGKDRPFQTFGPQFGAIYFRKGLAEMKLAKWDEAMASFEICYRDFPNKQGSTDGNPFEKTALLQWAEAAMGGKRWEAAITGFHKFLKERDKTRDTYPHGVVYVGLAVCHYQLGKVSEGNENLEIAIRNKTKFSTSDDTVLSGFQALVTIAVAKHDEQVVLDFIRKNRGGLKLEPCAMWAYTPMWMKLAGDAAAAEMPYAALELYQFIPPVETALDDVRARLQSMGEHSNAPDRKKLETTLASLEASLHGKLSPEIARLTAVAVLHEKAGDFRGAYAALLQLEQFHPEAANREDNLLHLIRISSRVVSGSGTRSHAEIFLKAFPDSPNAPVVRRLLWTGLFQNGDYRICIEAAQPVLASLKPGTPEHDDCLFVLGGSYHHLGFDGEARPLLAKHVELYSESPHALQAAYLQAANETRLRSWEKASAMLETFLAKHPDPSGNPYLPYALCDLATCRAGQGRPEAALEELKRVTDRFQGSGIIEVACLMRGDLERSLGKTHDAEKSYHEALTAAEKHADREMTARSLAALVVLLGTSADDSRSKEVAALADRFWKPYAESSPDKARVAAASAIAMDVAGRGDEGLSRLRDVICEAAGNPMTPEFENLIGSYTEAYLRKHGPEQLKEHYDSFLGIPAENPAARALLRVAAISVFENRSKQAKEPAARQSAEDAVKSLFQQLKTGFAIKDLGNFVLVRIGDFLRNHTSTPREALPYYEEVIQRKDDSWRFAALMGRADVFGRSSNPTEIDKGLADYDRVIKESGDTGEREFSFYQTIVQLIAKKDFVKAEERARFYLDGGKSGFSRFAPQVRLCLARSFDGRKMADEAILAYSGIWSENANNAGVSASAMTGWLRLMWERGKPGDRQTARDKGREYLERTRSVKDKMSEDDQELWTEVESIVKSFENQPEIKNTPQPH